MESPDSRGSEAHGVNVMERLCGLVVHESLSCCYAFKYLSILSTLSRVCLRNLAFLGMKSQGDSQEAEPLTFQVLQMASRPHSSGDPSKARIRV